MENLYATLGVFAATQIIALVVVVATLRSDNRFFREQMRDVKDELKKLNEIMTVQAVQTQRVNTLDDRVLANGILIADLTRRYNIYVDGKTHTAGE